MSTERPIGRIPLEVVKQAEQFAPLIGQDLGVYSVGVLPEGGNGLIVQVIEGMPDEFKDVLASVVPGVIVSFREIPEPRTSS